MNLIYTLYPRLPNYNLQVKSGPPPISTSKVLLEHRHAIYLHIILGCFRATTAEVNSCDRDSMDHKAQNIYCLLLYRKSVPTPTLNQVSSTTTQRIISSDLKYRTLYILRTKTNKQKSLRNSRCVDDSNV